MNHARNTLTAVRFTQEHAELLRVILQSVASEQLLTPIMSLGLEDGKRFFGDSEVPDELVAHHFASSMISLLQWWLEHDMSYSVEEIPEDVYRLLIRPIKRLKL